MTPTDSKQTTAGVLIVLLVVTLAVAGVLTGSVAAQAQEATVQETTVDADGSQLTITSDGLASVSVTDLPAGSSVSSISDDGAETDAGVLWNDLTGLPETVTFTLTPPEGVETIQFNVNGNSVTLEISQDGTIEAELPNDETFPSSITNGESISQDVTVKNTAGQPVDGTVVLSVEDTTGTTVTEIDNTTLADVGSAQTRSITLTGDVNVPQTGDYRLVLAANGADQVVNSIKITDQTQNAVIRGTVLTGTSLDSNVPSNVEQINIQVAQDGNQVKESPVQPDQNGQYMINVPVNSGESTYSIQVDNPRFVTYSRDVTVQAQSTKTVDIKLEPSNKDIDGQNYTYRLPFVRNEQKLTSSLRSRLQVTAQQSDTTVRIDNGATGDIDETQTLGDDETTSFSQPSAGTIIRSSAPVKVDYTYASADFGAYEDDNQRYGVPKESLLGEEYYLPIEADQLAIAATAPTDVQVDTTADGTFDQTRTLSTNEVVTIDTVQRGTHIRADEPIHVVAERSEWGEMDNTLLTSLLSVETALQEYDIPAEPDYSRENPNSKTGVYIAGTEDGTTITTNDSSVPDITLDAGDTEKIQTTDALRISADAPVVATYTYHVEARDPWTSTRRDYIGATTPVKGINIQQGSWSGTSEDVSIWSTYTDESLTSEDRGGNDPDPAAFSIALENVSASTGELTRVNLTASGDIAGYTAEINFDPTEVQINTVTGEDISDPVTNLDNDQGELTITQSEGSLVTDPTLAQISLQAVGSSGTPLEFDPNETTLNNEETGLPISEYVDGEVAVSRCAPGDANVNGQIGYIDEVLVKRHIAGLSAPGFDAECADISGDGDVTALDATQISQEILSNLLSPASNTGSTDTGTVTTAAVPDSDTTRAATPGTATLSVGSVAGAPGDQVTIPVSIDGSAIGYGARIEYNSEMIEVQSVEGLALDTEGDYDNSEEAIALTGSQTTVADDPGVVAEVTATIVGQQDTESAITVDDSNTDIDVLSGDTTVETEDGSVTVSEGVAIVNPTLTPTKVSASAQIHTLSFEAVGVSADGAADEFTITMPASVDIEAVNSANITNRDNDITASVDGNTITFEADPDQPAETVDLAIELDVELSESEEVN